MAQNNVVLAASHARDMYRRAVSSRIDVEAALLSGGSRPRRPCLRASSVHGRAHALFVAGCTRLIACTSKSELTGENRGDDGADVEALSCHFLSVARRLPARCSSLRSLTQILFSKQQYWGHTIVLEGKSSICRCCVWAFAWITRAAQVRNAPRWSERETRSKRDGPGVENVKQSGKCRGKPIVESGE